MAFTVLEAVAELGRSLIAERVRAGLRNVKAKCRKLGRPRVAVDAAQVARLRLRGGKLARNLQAARRQHGTAHAALR